MSSLAVLEAVIRI